MGQAWFFRVVSVASMFTLASLMLSGCGGEGGPVLPGGGETPLRATYVGSETCQRCHLLQFASWKQTFHARMILPVNELGALMAPVLGQLAGVNVAFTLGSHFRQRYIFLEGSEYWVAKGQYVKATGDASSLQPAKDKKWESCMTCHTTGYDPGRTPHWAMNDPNHLQAAQSQVDQWYPARAGSRKK